jgi:serine/threonine protein kinase
VWIFNYARLHKATGGFAEENKIRAGDAGGVNRAEGLVTKSGCYRVERLDEGNMQRLPKVLQELQLLIGCPDTNLLPVRGLSFDDIFCTVTEIMDGGCLEDRLFPQAEDAMQRLKLVGVVVGVERPKALIWQERLRIGAEIAAELEHLHTRKPAILRRDLKPANVLLDAKLHAKLGVAGLARVCQDDQTKPGTSALMSGFMDPDYKGLFNKWCDGYALGVTLLMLLTGRREREDRETLVDFCSRRDAEELADEDCQWPTNVARGMLEVARGLVALDQGNGTSVPDACRKLKKMALEKDAMFEQGAENHRTPKGRRRSAAAAAKARQVARD